MPTFDLEPVKDSFFHTADNRFSYHIDTTASADRVWEAIASPTPLTWTNLLHGEYITRAPHGVGALRDVTVRGGALRLREHFFKWDDDTRTSSFYVEHATLPVFRSFAENYAVHPTTTGSRFTWTFAYNVRPRTALTNAVARPINQILFNKLVRDTRRYLTAAQNRSV